MDPAIAAILGVLAGAALVLALVLLRRPATRQLAQQLAEQAEAQRLRDLEALLERIRGSFAELSQAALRSNNEQFLQLAETKLTAQTRQGESALDARKRLIDETVKQVTTRLTEVQNALQLLDKDRRESHGKLSEQLANASQVTNRLQQTTAALREALASPQRRGQWGERMAADVLRLAGFVENVNYTKQTTTESGRRPDYTFPLPNDRQVNMDVKFPIARYLEYLDAPDDAARDRALQQFLRDVRQRIREVVGREYIDPAAGTVDYVLLFIPNEQIYGFIHEHDSTLLDEALQQKVVLCGPMTLYAILAVIRQASENLRVEEASREILALLGAFQKEWDKYSDLIDKMGKALEQARTHFDNLTTTRTRKLERQLDRIAELRTRQRVALPEPDDEA